MPISLATALALAQTTLRRGRDVSAAPLTVAVLDTGGHIKVVLREDGAGLLRTAIAIGKAWGALGMGFSGAEQARRAESAPQFFAAITVASGGRLVPVPGGLLVHDRAGGELLGAIGVSGDTSQVDEECAVTATRETGLHCE